MNDVESWIARYFAAREDDPGLTPDAFLHRHPEAPDGLGAALTTATGLAGLLAGAGETTPTRIAGWTIVRELGRGAMGVVYEVERAGERAALKSLPALAAASEHARARFDREARALQRVRHPGIVRVLDVGVAQGCPFLVMALVPGTTLAQTRGPLPPLPAATLVAALADATAAAHAAGVVHRDIKPANVLVGDDGTPVLVDFGLAAVVDDSGLTATGDVLGTPRYMAPEQAAGRRGDERSDVYALGLLLYELVAGHPARAQTDRDAALSSARRGEIAPLRRVRPDAPQGLGDVLGQALARAPHRRYATAADFAADLRRFVSGRAVLGRAPGLSARAADALRENRALRAAVLAGAVLSTGLALWIWIGSQARAALRLHQADAALGAFLTGLDASAAMWAAPGIEQGDDPLLRGIRAALDPAPLTADDRWGAAVGALRQRPAEAAEAWAQSDHPLAPALRAHALLRSADPAGAAAIALPDPALLCARLARGWLSTGDAALALLTPTAADGPPIALVLHTARAQHALRRGEVVAGVAAARAAASLAAAEPRGLAGFLVSLLDDAPDPAALRAHLEDAVTAAPDDAELRFALAYARDVDHDIVAAARHYRAVVDQAPEHARALLCLAHLHSGADRETCTACADAFARHPEALDRPAAAALALRALAAAGARDLTILDAGMRIATAAGAGPELTAWLTRAHEGGGPLRARLEWWLRRVERAGR